MEESLARNVNIIAFSLQLVTRRLVVARWTASVSQQSLRRFRESHQIMSDSEESRKTF